MNNVRSIGLWSAVFALVFAAGYSVAQILSSAKIISHPQDLFWLFLPSLFLAPAFLVAMICLNFIAGDDQRIWTTIGWAFAALYCVMVTLVYFTQLTVVLPVQLKGGINNTHVLIFETKTFLMAVDCLGYFFMSLSTFFAAFAFRKKKKQLWLYRGLLWNGALMPVLVLAFFLPGILLHWGDLDDNLSPCDDQRGTCF